VYHDVTGAALDNPTGKMLMPACEQFTPESLERFREYLLMRARGLVGPKYRAKVDVGSIVNQVLFTAYRERDQLRGCGEIELLAWLRTVLGGKVNDGIRFQHRDKRDVNREVGAPAAANWDESCSLLLEVTAGWTSPSMQIVKQERELQLARALALLPEAQRDAIELHHLHGCTLAETAKTMDRTVAAVVGLLRRGLKRLRELLQDVATGDQ
jgi:RNA polymerase sigma-70 factor, ECF subfamily